MPRRSPTRRLLAILAAAALSVGCGSGSRRVAPSAVDGVLDLRSWDFSGASSVSLAGEWDFFPGELLGGEAAVAARKASTRRVPDRWDYGFRAGTYRLTVLLPEGHPALGIKYTTVSSAFELDADGLELAAAGRPSADRASAVPAYRPGVAILGGRGDRVTLVVRVSNWEYRVGGMWRAFSLGEAASMERLRWLRTQGSLVIAAALVMGAFFSLAFLRDRDERRISLCFAAFALAAALRSLTTGEYAIVECLPDIAFDAIIRLEYLSLFSLFLFGLLFLKALYPEELGPTPSRVLVGVCAASFLLLLAPVSFLTWSVLPYYCVAAAGISAATLMVVRAIAHRRGGGIPLGISGVVISTTALNDMLFSGFLLNSMNLFPYGVIVLVEAQIYTIAVRYKETKAKLRETIGQKDMLIREVHHRVKNSFQIVASIIALQSHRTVDASIKEAFKSIRDRIRAISLMHEKLYSLESAEDVDLGAYARDLLTELARSFGSASEGGPDLESESLRLPPDFCIDVGLVLTELVVNAYKHGGASGVSVRIRADGKYLLVSVADRGPGFPEGFDPEQVTTLGFKLVVSIVGKRKGDLRVGRSVGALVEVRLQAPREQLKEKRKE